MTHDFIHTSLYCRFYRLSTENVIKKRVTVVVFKISDLENINFASFSTRRYNGVLWKMHFLGLPSCIKTFILKKRVIIFCSKTNTVWIDDGSLHESKNMSRSPT